jgi:hypothetical protein
MFCATDFYVVGRCLLERPTCYDKGKGVVLTGFILTGFALTGFVLNPFPWFAHVGRSGVNNENTPAAH